MVRRSFLVTMAVATSVAWAAIAHAETAHAATAPSAPRLATAPFVSPALLQWTPGADPANLLQTVFRAPGACTQPPTAAIAVRTYPDNTTAQHFAQPGDGTFCFSIGATDVLGATAVGPGLTVTIDTTPPTATVAVSGQAAGGVVQGTVRITRTSADAVSGVASSVLHVGPVGACASGPAAGASWDTTTYANGSYDVCNVVTDRAGLVTTALVTVTVANPVPPPAPVAPALAPSAVAPSLAVAPSAPVLGGAVDKDAPGAPSRLAVVLPRAKQGAAKLVPLTLRWVNPKAADLARVVVILNLRHAPRSSKGRERGVQRAAHLGRVRAAPGQDRLCRPVRLRPCLQCLRSGPAHRVARLADPAAPAHGHTRLDTASHDVAGRGGRRLLQHPGIPHGGASSSVGRRRPCTSSRSTSCSLASTHGSCGRPSSTPAPRRRSAT